MERTGDENLTNCPSCGARIELLVRTVATIGGSTTLGCICPNCDRSFPIRRARPSQATPV